MANSQEWYVYLMAFTVSLAIFSSSLVQAASGPGSLEARMQQKHQEMLASMQELRRRLLPTKEDLGEGWKLPWELPSIAPLRYETEKEYWEKLKVSPHGLDASLAQELVQQILASAGKQAADANAGPEEPERPSNPGTGSQDSRVQAQSDQSAKESISQRMVLFALLMQAITDRLTPAQTMEQGLGTLAHFARKVGAELQSGKALPSRNASKELYAFLSEPYNDLSNAELADEIAKELTLIKQQSEMTFAKSNNWQALPETKTDKDMVKKGIWLGLVTVRVMVVDPVRRGEFPNLDDAGALELQRKLNGFLADFRSFEQKRKRRETEDRIAEVSKDLESAQAGLRETEDEVEKGRILKQIGHIREQIAALWKKLEDKSTKLDSLSVQVYTRDIGENCYVVRLTGHPQDTPALQVSLYSAWLRNGNALVRIKFDGNFPEDEMTRAMDRFLGEMDARTSTF
jgi:hypothetical protein